MEFLCVGREVEFQYFDIVFLQRIEHMLGTDFEELSTEVDLVHTLCGELLMKHRFDTNGVLAEEQSVDVEPERYRRISELLDSIHRLKTAGHPDLDSSFTQRTDIGDDIYVPGADICRPVVDVLDGVFDVGEPFLQTGHTVSVSLRVEGRNGVEEVGALLVEPFLLRAALPRHGSARGARLYVHAQPHVRRQA